MTETVAGSSSEGRPVTRFDLNDRGLGERQPKVLAALRDRCPVGYRVSCGVTSLPVIFSPVGAA